MADLKSTHLVDAGGHHEIAYGWHPEYVTFNQERWYSGPLGNRALIQLYPQAAATSTPTRSSRCSRASSPPTSARPASGPATDLLYPPDYQDSLKANVSSIVNAFFLQENYSPPGLRNLTINAGARLEFQKLYDFHGQAFLDATNVSPRIGAIYDPRNDGRSKISVFYGRYYEAIPLNVAARYFGGEGILQRNGVPFSDCATPRRTRTRGTARPSSAAATAREVDGDDPTPDGQRGGRQRPLQQRHQLRRAVQPARPVPQRDRRHGRARDLRGHDRAPRLPAPLAGDDHRGRRGRPDR